MIISLTGFMGCGKSSVGRRLSELLCCDFADLDTLIEQKAGRTIPEIFFTDGEAEFRRIEKEVLKGLLSGSEAVSPGQSLPSQATGPSLCGQRGSTVPDSQPHCQPTDKVNIVLALGGGAVMTEGSAQMVHDKSICIYLKASVDTLLTHLCNETSGRPLLNKSGSTISSQVETSDLRSRIMTLMSLRAETYERTAHHIIDTDGKSIATIASDICHILNKK